MITYDIKSLLFNFSSNSKSFVKFSCYPLSRGGAKSARPLG